MRKERARQEIEETKQDSMQAPLSPANVLLPEEAISEEEFNFMPPEEENADSNAVRSLESGAVTRVEKPNFWLRTLDMTSVSQLRSFCEQSISRKTPVHPAECMDDDNWRKLQTKFFRVYPEIRETIDVIYFNDPKDFFYKAVRCYPGAKTQAHLTPAEPAASARLVFNLTEDHTCLNALDDLETTIRDLQNLTLHLESGCPQMMTLLDTVMKSLKIGASQAQLTLVTRLRANPEAVENLLRS